MFYFDLAEHGPSFLPEFLNIRVQASWVFGLTSSRMAGLDPINSVFLLIAILVS